jgi:scyllo-inositol 2-dehydrogenase (NADP+)
MPLVPQPVKIAVVGCGWVAHQRHLPVMERDARFDVVGVIDRKPGQAEDVALRRGLRHHAQATRLSEVRWIDEVDAVTVAAAPMAHYDLAKEALTLHKHVLVEKPFAMTVEEGEDIVQTAKRQNRCLAVVHNFQFARSVKRLLAEIASGALGRVRGIDAVQFGNPLRRLPEWYEKLPLGLFYDEIPHLLYLTRAVAGPMRLSRATIIPSLTGSNTPARVEAWFDGAVDYPMRLACNFESPVSEWYLMILGEKRLGIIDVFRDIYLSLPNDGVHGTRQVIRTSLVATFQHWLQHVTSGIPYLAGRLFYGNDEVFARFAASIGGDVHALGPIGPTSALDTLRLQHAIINDRQAMAEAA